MNWLSLLRILLPALVQYRVSRGSKDPWESGIEAFVVVADKLDKAGVIENAEVETTKTTAKPKRVP